MRWWNANIPAHVTREMAEYIVIGLKINHPGHRIAVGPEIQGNRL